MIEQLKKAELIYLQSSRSIREISNDLKINRQILTGWLLAKGLEIKNRRCERRFNPYIFDTIDSEEKAYWLGFLYADGNIHQHNKSYQVELSLSMKDLEHLKKFASFIGLENIKTSITRCRCILGSKHLFERLNEIGCIECKSLTLEFPKIEIFSDSYLVKHFIRGYVDGDGCLSYRDKLHNNPNVSILGTTKFLNKLQNFFTTKQNTLSNNSKSQDITKVLQFSGKTALNFASFLYEGANVYLDRKYFKYKEYCRLYEES